MPLPARDGDDAGPFAMSTVRAPGALAGVHRARVPARALPTVRSEAGHRQRFRGRGARDLRAGLFQPREVPRSRGAAARKPTPSAVAPTACAHPRCPGPRGRVRHGRLHGCRQARLCHFRVRPLQACRGRSPARQPGHLQTASAAATSRGPSCLVRPMMPSACGTSSSTSGMSRPSAGGFWTVSKPGASCSCPLRTPGAGWRELWGAIGH